MGGILGGACSVSCGSGGVQHRTRLCNTTEVECKGPDRESQICSASVRWNGWNPWGACSVSCGSGGVQHRTRSCNTTEVECKGPDRETQNCSASIPCPPAPVCFEQYTTLSEWYRKDSRRSGYNCDRDKVDGSSWYRFQLETGENGVLEHCPGDLTCGTLFQISVLTTSHALLIHHLGETL